MNDTKIASKTKAQLANFMGKVFTHFSKPSRRFIEECIYGIQASSDTKLSSIVRAIDDDIRPIYTEKRLSRNMDDEALEASVAEAVLRDGARSVRSDTLLLVDPTEIRKEFSYKMEFVTRVRDAKGRSVLSRGGMHEVHDLARQCTMRHSHHVTFDSHGKECDVPISFGAMPVRNIWRTSESGLAKCPSSRHTPSRTA